MTTVSKVLMQGRDNAVAMSQTPGERRVESANAIILLETPDTPTGT